MTQYLSQGNLALLVLRAFLWGAGLGLLYSVFGIRRAAFWKLRIPRWISSVLLHIEDFLICITGAVGLSILYFATTRGVLRVMAIPFLGLGILTWRLSGGRLVTICTDAILNLLAVICRSIYRRILAPIWRAVQEVCRKVMEKLSAARTKRYYRRLKVISQKQTVHYRRALMEACGRGVLPTFRGGQRVRRASVQRKKKKAKNGKRNKRNRKESSI